jgi:HEAT repeat protein
MQKRTEDEQLELDFTPAPSLAAGKKALAETLFRCYLNDLASENPRVRKKGVKGIGSLGAAARQAAPLLENLLEDPDRKVREAAELALRSVRR